MLSRMSEGTEYAVPKSLKISAMLLKSVRNTVSVMLKLYQSDAKIETAASPYKSKV